MRTFVITIICLALTVPPAFARMYKWVDKDGKMHFTDSLSKVPLDQRTKKHIKKMEFTEGGSYNLPTAQPSTSKHPSASNHLGTKKEGSHNKDTGVDKQKVKDLQRLIQKKHYNH